MYITLTIYYYWIVLFMPCTHYCTDMYIQTRVHTHLYTHTILFLTHVCIQKKSSKKKEFKKRGNVWMLINTTDVDDYLIIPTLLPRLAGLPA